ncbi:MAG: HAD family hydrolase [Leptolyngbyaceae cyanobacterium]
MVKSIQNPSPASVSFQATDATLKTITALSKNEVLIFDFDETLFLRNSTEEYLNSLQPKFLGALVLFALSFIKPWNWIPSPKFRGDISRDWFRIVISTILFPWTPLVWRSKAKRLARDFANQELLQAAKVSQISHVVVASNGYRFIIQPIVDCLPLPMQPAIACRFWQGVQDRFRGKLALVTDELGPSVLARAAVVTDSEDDLPLLRKASKPCLTLWPEAKYMRAMGKIYFPFFYTEKVKQLNRNYLKKVILAEDLVFLCLATTWISPSPLLHAISMAFLMSAFWCVYEIGYMENDLIAEKLESTPNLTDSYLRNKDRIDLYQPWIWVVLFSIPGVILLQLANINPAWNLLAFNDAMQSLDYAISTIELGKWMAFLLFVRFTFWVYNYVNKSTRIWLYPLLQIYKSFGFLVLTMTNLVGSMFFAAQTLSRWICYFVYRYSKGSWYKVGQILRFCIFALLMMAVAFGINDFRILLNWQAACIFVYAVIKATREMRVIVKDLGLITDPSKS